MSYKIIPINGWYFKFRAPLYLKNEFKYPTQSLEWNVYLKRYTYKKDVAYIYSNLIEVERDIVDFVFGIGFAPFILYHYGKYLDRESQFYLRSSIDKVEHKFDGLTDEQQSDLNSLLKLRRGIFQVYTGYGKTEIIAHLINYIVNVRKERLLLLTPNQKPLNEIDHRVKKLFGMTHSYFDYQSDYNAININGFPKSNEFDEKHPYWNTVKWIIAEEVEYVINNTGCKVISLCKNAERSYAFSATADKKSGERIRMREGNIPVVQRNSKLINYFGFAAVYKKPEDFTINLKEISTTIFNDVNESFDKNSEYSEVIYSIFTDHRFCSGLTKIIQKETPLYIPMGRLEVIDHWLKNYFNISEFVVINICGRGYELYIGGELKGGLELEEVKMYIEDEAVNLITGTSSSYRALDFPKLNKVLPLTSKIASLVIQAVGRVCRGKDFTIINLKPFVKVNMYTNDYYSRKKLISDYYSECKVIINNKKDADYGIN